MKTKSPLRLQCERLERENTPLLLALNDLARGETKWFSNLEQGYKQYRIGVSRPQSACGGIVVEQVGGTVCGAFYFETWAREALEHISYCITGEDTDANRELLRRRSLIEDAQAYIRAAQIAA